MQQQLSGPKVRREGAEHEELPRRWSLQKERGEGVWGWVWLCTVHYVPSRLLIWFESHSFPPLEPSSPTYRGASLPLLKALSFPLRLRRSSAVTAKLVRLGSSRSTFQAMERDFCLFSSQQTLQSTATAVPCYHLPNLLLASFILPLNSIFRGVKTYGTLWGVVFAFIQSRQHLQPDFFLLTQHHVNKLFKTCQRV